MYQPYNNVNLKNQTNETITLNDLDNILKREIEKNNNQGWNKLDKTLKIQKLNIFANKFGQLNNYDENKINLLKQFLRDCLDKSKLKNTKDVYYNKDTKEITKIPSLYINNITHKFTLKNIEPPINKTVRNTPIITNNNIKNIIIKDKIKIIDKNSNNKEINI